MSRTCDRRGCGGAARWSPVIVCYPPGQPDFHAPIRATVGIAICEACRQETTIDEVMTDSAWARLVAAIVAQGRVAPDRDTVLLEFDPCG